MILGDAEFKVVARNRIASAYQTYLKRTATESEIEYWITKAITGIPLATLENEIKYTVEGYNFSNNITPDVLKDSGLPVGDIYLNSDLDERLQTLAKRVLNRELNDSELQFYFNTAKDDKDLSRVEILMRSGNYNAALDTFIPFVETPKKAAAVVSVGGALALAALFLLR